MKPPIIGINMDYTCYPEYPAVDTQFRDCYNIYAPYADAIAINGGLPLPIPCLEDRRLLSAYVDLVDGFVFTGGKDYPPECYGDAPGPRINAAPQRRVTADLKLARLVLKAGIPVLAICGGLQLMNIALGGKLIQHLDSAAAHRAPAFTRDTEHSVTLVGGTLLASIFRTDQMIVNSAHHQAVHPDCLGKGLKITALAGDGTIEALESDENRFRLGVQWHPERMGSDAHRQSLFRAFISACVQR